MKLIDKERLLRSAGYNEEYMSVGLEYIISAPTVDAVPVIRCKDCKFRNGELGQQNIICINMKDNDFCSYGERKNEV